MVPDFYLELSWENDVQLVQMSGNLTEHAEAEFKKASKALLAKKAIIDLSKLNTINSYGIAMWCQFLQDVTVSCEISLIHCPRVFIDAANMVRGVTEAVKVSSFSVPYFCSKCNHAVDVNVNNTNQPAQKLLAHIQVACEKCKKTLEPDCDLNDYLTFLSA